MISNIGKNPYLQQISNDRKVSQVNKIENVSELNVNSRVDEIRKGLEDGTYKLIPTVALAKIFAEAELFN